MKHFVVPESTTFNIDGKDMSVHELKPGMHLTRTVTTVTKSENVRNVKVIKGKVWMVNAPYLIVTLDSGQNKQFKAPDGMKFNVDGEEVSVFHLKKGMNLTATVVTTTPETIASSTSSVTGSAPVESKAPPKPATPTQVGALLIDESPSAQPVDVASNQAPPAAPEEKPARLPKTGSSVPLLGLLALISLSAGLALRIHRVR